EEQLRQDRERVPRKKVFEPVFLQQKRGPLVIHGKRWYFLLVRSKDAYRRSLSLMDDYTLNQIAEHMVVCFTPDKIPGFDKPFRTKEGEPGRIYAFFDSYVEFYQYMQKFDKAQRAFYEVAFGELPQKPHFDIDIDRTSFEAAFPRDNIDTVAETLREAVIEGCCEVLQEQGVTLNLEKDLLLYSSHGDNKRSYHVVLTNRCHDGNKEAKAFYDAVITKVHSYTQGKYRNQNFVDRGVYSPRQQFRIVGCQKWNSGRPKVFYEQFWYKGRPYNHIYNEDTTDEMMKKYTIIYESLISFTSGCSFLPSLVPLTTFTQNQLGDMPDLELPVIDQCLLMLRDKMKQFADAFYKERPHVRKLQVSPFTLKEIRGHLILLKRSAASHCPICQRQDPHDKEHPYMYIMAGKIYWDCRRAADNTKKFFVGYLTMSIEELGTTVVEDEDDNTGEFMFGDYDIGLPTLAPTKITPIKQVEVKQVEVKQEEIKLPIVPVEQRLQNVQKIMSKVAQAQAYNSYIKNEPQDVTGRVSLSSVKSEISWTAGYH
ncbi:MAG: hypothetical protein ABIQ41_05875, partial [Gemmatimonadales bacterium]